MKKEHDPGVAQKIQDKFEEELRKAEGASQRQRTQLAEFKKRKVESKAARNPFN